MNNEERFLDLMTRMHEQLVLLGNKLDILINESFKSRQHGGGQPQGQKYGQEHARRHEQQQAQQQRENPQQPEQKQEQKPEQQKRKHGRTMYKAICADCKVECELPFQPKDDRPVYCNECFAARKEAGRTFKQAVSGDMPKPKDVTPQSQNQVIHIDWRNEETVPLDKDDAQPAVTEEEKTEKRKPSGRQRPASSRRPASRRRPPKKK